MHIPLLSCKQYPLKGNNLYLIITSSSVTTTSYNIVLINSSSNKYFTYFESSVFAWCFSRQDMAVGKATRLPKQVVCVDKNDTYLRASDCAPMHSLLKKNPTYPKTSMNIRQHWYLRGNCHLVIHDSHWCLQCNVTGTLPKIPYPDMHPRIKCFVASLHGPISAGTMSKAIQYAYTYDRGMHTVSLTSRFWH